MVLGPFLPSHYLTAASSTDLPATSTAIHHCLRYYIVNNQTCQDDVMVKQLLFAHSIPGHPRPTGRPHLTWMETAMHDMGSLGRMLQIDLPRDWANLALHRDVWRGVVSRC